MSERDQAEPAPILDIEVTDLAAGGEAVGRDPEGRVVFVAGAAPGEKVRVQIYEQHSQFARAHLLEVLEASPDRIEPPCPLFRDRLCGGCTWQHLAISAQVRAKEQLVRSALRKTIAAGLEVLPILQPVSPLRWRRRARLHWARPKGSPRAIVGFCGPRSKRIVRVDHCVQIEPALDEALSVIQEVLAPGLFRRGEIDLLVDMEGRVQVAVRGPCRRELAVKLVDGELIVGVILGRQTFGEELLEIEPDMVGRADRFAQASRAGNRALVEYVEAITRPRDGLRVLELYAGSGNFTRLLTGAARVIAVDTHPAQPPEDSNVDIVAGRVEDVVADLAASGERFDLVLLDPPRTGARACLASLIILGARRIVYVSCDPATLARDLDQLAGSGYRAVTAQPIDMMPQTAQVEVIATLELGTTSPPPREHEAQ